jgi:hypothetical protein
MVCGGLGVLHADGHYVVFFLHREAALRKVEALHAVGGFVALTVAVALRAAAVGARLHDHFLAGVALHGDGSAHQVHVHLACVRGVARGYNHPFAIGILCQAE